MHALPSFGTNYKPCVTPETVASSYSQSLPNVERPKARGTRFLVLTNAATVRVFHGQLEIIGENLLLPHKVRIIPYENT